METVVVLAMLSVAACGKGSADQPSAEATDQECANTELKAAGSETGKSGNIAFSKEGDIYTMHPDGGEQTNLTAEKFGDEFKEVDSAFSPDGERIAFASDREDGFDFGIYVMDIDGTGITRLTEGPGWEVNPRWSPGGTKIEFTTEGSGGSAISVMNADGTCARTVRNQAHGYIGLNDWSPEGERMMVGVDRFSSGGEIDTYAMYSDGGHLRQLTDVPGDDSGARWSPDGENRVRKQP